MSQSQTEILAKFASELQYDEIPSTVVSRAKDLFVDWVGSALASKGSRPIETIAQFAERMGPPSGPSEILINRRTTSPLFAAMINGASSHFAEQDDVHNGSVFHPAAVVFPAALAVAQELNVSGKTFFAACTVGYEVGIRVGEFLGRSHYKVFHTTGTAGTIAAAATVGRLLCLSPERMTDAFGSAGTQAAGLWEFLGDAADSKPLHAGKAAANGLMAAYLARDGFTGARRIMEGQQGMGRGMSSDADPLKLVDRLGSRWALAETSFKYHASCRHTHPCADALLKLMQDKKLAARDIAAVTAQVHQGAIDVLGSVVVPATVHQAKFSMGTTLALIAVYGRAGLHEFEECFNHPEVADFRNKVRMELDAEVDAAYPARWIGKVVVETKDGQLFHARVNEPKGDPGNTLSRDEIELKFRNLVLFGQSAEAAEIEPLISRLWNISELRQLGNLMREKSA